MGRTVNHYEEIIHQLKESAETKLAMIESCSNDIEKAAGFMIAAIEQGKKILWCGNGGSAADAQHLSTELVGGLRSHDRQAVASIALTTDSSFLTAWSNDTSFVTVFSRQIEALGATGDVLVAISTSGNSANIIEAVRVAQSKGIKSIVLTGGSGGKLKELGSVSVCIPNRDTQRIQEGHITAGHILCELVESSVVAAKIVKDHKRA